MNKLVVDIYSFGFQMSGVPEDLSGNQGGFVFDCRFLPNPGRDPAYADLTGKDPEVIAFLSAKPQVEKLLEHSKALVDEAIDNYLEHGFTHLMVSYGCTGGQHRSVYCAEQLYQHLQSRPVEVRLRHVELE
ncbi:MAG: RNase adapter RapZ [bacterium]|nr:RNase adapter RapZ [bacterium]